MERAKPMARAGSKDAVLTEEQEKTVAKALLDLSREEEAVRTKAIETLADYARVVPIRISQGFRHELVRVRTASLRVFRLSPEPSIAESAMRLLRDQSAEVREEAVLLARKLAPPGYVSELLHVLAHEIEPRVIRQALSAIVSSHDLDAVEAIMDLMDRSADEYLQKKCADALRSLTGGAIKSNVEAWRDWWAEHEPRVRRERGQSRQNENEEGETTEGKTTGDGPRRGDRESGGTTEEQGSTVRN
jgi:hypothetical protein